MKKTRQEKGITLIALIITIVVLLILAAVAIRAVQGDGIIQYARNARNDYEQAQANEEAQLQNYLDVLDENNSKGDTTAPIVHNGIIPEGGVYTQSGTTYEAGDNFPVLGGYDEYVYGDYKYVYMSYSKAWVVTVIDKTKTSYGEIVSVINEGDSLELSNTFEQCTKLETAPKIPSTTVGMANIFGSCTALTDISNVEIPDGITSLQQAFYGCSALEDASTLKIPSTVKRMTATFQDCKALTKSPVIPSSVESMEGTFYNCTSLTGIIEINANPSAYDSCFSGVDFAAQKLTLTGSSNMLATLGGTGSNYQS